jgi:hypothetical protein
MYSITVNINDKPHTKRIPQSWNDVQWIDYINALQAQGELLSVLEALTGIPKRILDAMSETDFQFIETQCSFFWREPLQMENLPFDFIKVQIDSDTWQKLIDSEQEFKRVSELQLPQIAAAQLIIQTYSGIDIKGMRVPLALAYWDFFFSNSMSGRSDGQTSTTQRQMTMKLQQGLRRCNPSLGLQPLTRWRKETRPSMMRFYKKRLTSSIPSYYLIRRRMSMLTTSENTTSSYTRTISNEIID